MKFLSKISLLLLIVAFLGASAARADDPKKKTQPYDDKAERTEFSSAKVGNCNLGSASKDLDQNNIRARLYNNGHLFWKGSGNVYTVPKGGEANSIFASGIWIGGLAGGSELRFAGTAYGPFEFWPGPLDDAGNPPADCSQYDRIFIITRADIQGYENNTAHSSDVEDWPWELGAPVIDGDGNPNNYNLAGGDRPQLIGEQTAWWVMNDAGNQKEWSKTAPMNIEVQVTAFAFKTADALNNTTFYKYKMIYKGTAPLVDTYFGIWSDPDLGNAADDFVGSDTTRGIGFVYNGGDYDAGFDGYGDRPPALGYDFFQGPLVNNDGIDNDRDGEIDEDEERIAMSRFVYYNNDGSVQGNPSGSTNEPYDYMRGIWRDGMPITEGGTGYGGDIVTNYMFPGDPSTRSYWSEENTDGAGARNTPSDRRFILSAGPFTMNPGDVQDIVYGIVWAQAGDRLASVSKMKSDDALAQAAFDVDFELPSPPDAPRVAASTSDQTVVLTWSYLPSDNNFLNSYDIPNPFLKDVDVPDKSYSFEGYRIYRYANAADQDGVLVATLDVVNGVTAVTDVTFDSGTGEPITVVSARGNDTGAGQSYTFTNLTNYTDYFYGVQAYAYNEFSAPKIYDGPITRIQVTPTRVDARDGGSALATEAIAARVAASDTLGFDLIADKVTVAGNGVISANIIDPVALTGHEYQVQFFNIEETDDHGDTHVVGTTYDIVDATTGAVKLDGQDFFNRTGQMVPQRDDVALIDGLSFSINGPEPGFSAWTTIANAAGPLDYLEGCGADWAHFPGPGRSAQTGSQQVGEGYWLIHTGDNGDRYYYDGDNSFLTRSMRNGWGNVVPYDFEVRFTEGGSTAWDAFQTRGGQVFHVPFELWNIGIGTPDDPSDDYRLIPYVIDWDGDGWNLQCFDHVVSGGNNDPESDWIYWRRPTDHSPGEAGYLAWEAAALAFPVDADGFPAASQGDFYGSLSDAELIGRMVFVNWNGGDVGDCVFDQDEPETGTIFRLETYKPNQPGDVFSFDTSDIGVVTGDKDIAEANLAKIGIVPNPYKGVSAYEIDTTADQVRFTNLPERAHIRVYTLSGTLIWDQYRGMDNNKWDLKTSEGLPIASGMYIIHVEVVGVGEQVIKFGVVKKRIQLDLI